MHLKNYTSTVPPSRSVFQIEQILVSIGANHISKTFDNGNLTGITFQIIQDDLPVVFKLPANVSVIQEMLLSNVQRPRKGTIDRLKDQAHRTAWKLLLDWTQVQASMILIGRRSAIEVFLPYVYDMQQDQTLFEKLERTQFKMLTSGEPI